MFYPAALWAATVSLYFLQIKIVQPKAQKHHHTFKCSKEIRRKLTKQRFLQHKKMQNAMMKKKLQYTFLFMFKTAWDKLKTCKLLMLNLCHLELQIKILKKLSFLAVQQSEWVLLHTETLTVHHCVSSRCVATGCGRYLVHKGQAMRPNKLPKNSVYSCALCFGTREPLTH